MVTTSYNSLVLQPIINSLEQIVLQSNNINEPNIIGQIGFGVQSVPCQMALINICEKLVEAATVDSIIAEEAYSTTSFLHEIGTRVLFRCMEFTPIDVVLQNARGIIHDSSDTSSFITTANKSLSTAKKHMMEEVREYQSPLNRNLLVFIVNMYFFSVDEKISFFK